MPFMNRALYLAVFLLMAISASAADRFARNAEEISIATTGRIVKVDAKNRTFKVRGSDGPGLSLRSVSQNFAQVVQGVRRIGITLPGGITIALPGKGRNSTKTSQDNNNLDEYTVVVLEDTVFQDGAEPLRFEDFRNGEIISIHGSLTERTITASRIAKWF
jgi:hypothetical protein